jgi:hypothetical protein
MYRDFETAIQNVSNYIFVTNHLNSIQMEDGDRRYFALEVSSEKKQNHEYFEGLLATVKHPRFYANLLTYLLNMDISTFNPNQPPMTELKREMLSSTMGYAETFVRERFAILLRREFGRAEWRDGRLKVTDVWRAYVAWLDDQGANSSKYAGTKQGFWSKVKHLLLSQKVGGTQYYWARDELRSTWAEDEEEGE